MGSLRTIRKEKKEETFFSEYYSISESQPKNKKLDYTPYTLEQLQAKKWKPFVSISCDCSNIKDEYYKWVKKYIEVPHRFMNEFSICKFFNPGFAYVMYQCTKCNRTLSIHIELAEDLSVWDYKLQTEWYHQQFGND
jgi:hypothetical protein